MTKRAYWQRESRQADGSYVRYTMGQIWDIGQIVVVAGTQYMIHDDGWKKIGGGE